MKQPFLKNTVFYRLLIGFLATAGILAITQLDNLFGTSIPPGDELAAVGAWTTAMVVAYFSVESIETSRNGQKQNKLQEEIMMNEFMPIIYPLSGILQGDSFRIALGNDGKGLARNIKVNLGSVTVIEGRSIKGKDRADFEGEQHLDSISLMTSNQNILALDLEIVYQDIYKRTFRTLGCTYRRDEPEPGNRFILQSEKWEFKKS